MYDLRKLLNVNSFEELIKEGALVHIRTNGQMYDGVIQEVTDNAIILAEDCKTAVQVKIIYKQAICGIELRAEYMAKKMEQLPDGAELLGEDGGY